MKQHTPMIFNKERAYIAALPKRTYDGSIILSLSVPCRAISPNAATGRSLIAVIKKSVKIKDHKKVAWLATLEALTEEDRIGGRFAGYSLRHFFKTAAFRDDDNADAACKAYRDGICQALGIDDKHFKKLRLSTCSKDALNPRVEIKLHISK